MKFFSRILIYCFVFTNITLVSGQELSIISWNLKDFGKSRDNEEIKLIAQVLRGADIVAIQEVVAKDPGGAQAVARLADQLNRMGAKWDYRISDPTNSPSAHISERYAYLWKTSKVTITGGRPYLIKEIAAQVHREPYTIQFKTRNSEILTLLNFHACTHKKHNPERLEIQAITDWLVKQDFENVIWAGDMNLVIEDKSFDKAKSYGYVSALNGEKTSLKTKCKNGKYLSRAEDNVLYKFSTLSYLSVNVLDFIRKGDCSEVSWKRTSYSDHLGVEVKISTVVEE